MRREPADGSRTAGAGHVHNAPNKHAAGGAIFNGPEYHFS